MQKDMINSCESKLSQLYGLCNGVLKILTYIKYSFSIIMWYWYNICSIGLTSYYEYIYAHFLVLQQYGSDTQIMTHIRMHIELYTSVYVRSK